MEVRKSEDLFSGIVFSLLRGERQQHRDPAAALPGVFYVELSAVAGDYLVAHGKTDTGAAVLGAALVELLLDMGKLRLGYAVTVVPDDDMDV